MSKILNKLSSCVIIDEKTEGVNKRTVIKVYVEINIVFKHLCIRDWFQSTFG